LSIFPKYIIVEENIESKIYGGEFMWSRFDLKTRAKQNLNNCYWKAVLVAFILSIISGGSSGGANARLANARERLESDSDYFYHTYLRHISFFTILIFLTVFLVIMFIGIAVRVFLFAPIEVGCKRFFIMSRVQETELNELGFAFTNGYWNVVKTEFLRSLFISLWSMLFVIPGIIKSYEYRMIPYLLAENPKLEYSEAFRISKELMDGQKWDTFILDLSFFGWMLLSACTCGILSVFYVAPYMAYTDAELYIVLQYHRYNRINNMGGYESARAENWVYK